MTIQDIFDHICGLKDKDERDITEIFQKLPPKRELPLYYEIITNPIDLHDIGSRARGRKYASLEEFAADLNLMVANAHKFNQPGSQVYLDATRISKAFQKKLAAAQASLHVVNMQETLDALRALTDKKGRKYSDVFEVLPDRAELPQYYQLVAHPMDLTTVQQNITSGLYANGESFNKDVLLVFDNAMFFNEESSTYYQDAKKLKETFLLLVNISEDDLAAYSANRDGSSQADAGVALISPSAPKAKKKPVVAVDDPPLPKLIIKTSTLPTADDDAQAEKASKKGAAEGGEDAKRARLEEPETQSKELQDKKKLAMQDILDRIYAGKDKRDGHSTGEAFMSLPARPDYPDYYQVIKSPISLEQIQKRLDEDVYKTFDAFLDDLELMYNNALQYNAEGSLLFRDASLGRRTARNRVKVAYERVFSVGPPSSTPDPTQPLPAKRESALKARFLTDSSLADESMTPEEAQQAREAKAEKDKLDLMNAIVKAVINHVDADDNDRSLSYPFMELPSDKDYPDYYEVIKTPIDLKTIRQRVKSRSYEAVSDLMADLELIFTNAQTYNQEGSIIFQDAVTLLKVARKIARQALKSEGRDHDGDSHRPKAKLNLEPIIWEENEKDYEGATYETLGRPYKQQGSEAPDPLQVYLTFSAILKCI